MQLSKLCLNFLVLCWWIAGFDCQLIYKYEKAYKPTWQDKNSGATLYLSIWQPYDQRFFPLGDVIHDSYNYPNKSVMMVLDKGDGLVSPPINFTSIWNDRGSGASQNIEIYRMEPKPGYVCLGHVAVNAYSRLPDKNAYRCVKSHLVTRGISKMLWNSKGSPVKVRMSFWNVEPDPLEPMGLETGLFLLGSSINSPPVVTPFVIYSNMATTTETVPNGDFAVSLFRTMDVKLVWSDKGFRNISFWRPKTECCSLGDVVSDGYHPSPAFYAKDIKNNSLAKPTNFERVYWNKNDDGGQQLSIWRPVCPRAFEAIGHIANPNFNMPSVEDIRCVNSSLVTAGQWSGMAIYIGATLKDTEDCIVTRADASNDKGVGLSVMSAFKFNETIDTPAYVLKRGKVKLMV